MDRTKPIRLLKRRGLAPCVGSLEAYKIAKAPSKHKTIYGCRDEFLKEIYSYETNSEWRRMCLKHIYGPSFLEKIAKEDPNERIRKQAALSSDCITLIVCLRDNDPSPIVQKYVKEKLSKLPNSIIYMINYLVFFSSSYLNHPNKEDL